MANSVVQIRRVGSAFEFTVHPVFGGLFDLISRGTSPRVPQASRPEVMGSLDEEDAEWLAIQSQEAYEIRRDWFSKLVLTENEESWIVFTLNQDGVEQLLQIINDLRLECWASVGRPDPLPDFDFTHFLDFRKYPENPTTVLAALELGGFLQTAILEAFEG